MNVKNYARFEFMSVPENVALARSCVAALVSQLNCTLEDLEEIKLVVSEAVSNCIIHGYEHRRDGKISILVTIYDNHTVEITISDFGKGIEDLDKALQPSFSTDPARMGLGMTFMKSFMDEMEVNSVPNEGTSVRLRRSFLIGDQEAYA